MGSARAGWGPTCWLGGLREVLTLSEPPFLLLEKGDEDRTCHVAWFKGNSGHKAVGVQ